MGSIVVVGSINVDLTSYLDRWPDKGETIKTRATNICTGGKGANQSCAAAKLGAKTYMIGAMGQDGFGQDAENALVECGVLTLTIKKAEQSTGMAFIDVGPDGDNIIRISEGANGSLSAHDIQNSWRALEEKCDILLLQNEVPIETSLAAAKLARQNNVLTIMDPAPILMDIWSDDVFAHFDIITPNMSEASAILGQDIASIDDALQAARILSGKVKKGAIITLGDQGLAWVIEGQGGSMRCPKVDSIDTVAAGDCFNGALAYALSQGRTYSSSISFACHAASLATTKKGAIESLPKLSEVDDFVKICVNTVV